MIDSTVLWLTMRQLFARRRVYLAIAFSLAPLLISLVYRMTADSESSGVEFLTAMVREIVIGTLLPLAAVVFGTSAFGGEVDDGTLIYLLVKPLPRWRVVLSKYVVAVACTAVVILPAVVFPWLLVRPPQLAGSALVGFLAGVGVGCLLYCAIFVALGLSTRRALVAGLIYVVGIEMTLSRSLAGAKSLSVREFAISISQTAANGALKMTAVPVSMATVWTMGTIMLVGAMGLAVWKLKKYEVAERM